jgi:cobalt-precorrin-5B (C1)-methyltransferase
MSAPEEARPLRRGWTTGTCAAAATKAAAVALWSGDRPATVTVTLPNGARPEFTLAFCEPSGDCCRAGVVKDAGDDPDVTHGALIVATVRALGTGNGVQLRAGRGVGTVTRPGLPLAVGEPAINPVPREMIRLAVAEAAEAHGKSPDLEVVISVPGGDEIAKRTLNPRLGIIGGISILGTTGIVIPYSCSAWIHSIHRGIDVARAAGLTHIAGATGATSEAAVAKLHRLPEQALIDMGDFVGGMLKYLRSHPVPRVTIAGGFAKMTKLAQGRLDLHSRRGEVDLVELAHWLAGMGATEPAVTATREANSALEALSIAHAAGLPIAQEVASRALATAAAAIKGSGITIDVAVFDRDGQLLAVSPCVRT